MDLGPIQVLRLLKFSWYFNVEQTAMITGYFEHPAHSASGSCYPIHIAIHLDIHIAIHLAIHLAIHRPSAVAQLLSTGLASGRSLVRTKGRGKQRTYTIYICHFLAKCSALIG